MKRFRLFKRGRTAAAVLVLVFLASCVSPRIAPVGKTGNVRFGIVTDSHYADIEPRGTRFYRESLAKMGECVEVGAGGDIDIKGFRRADSMRLEKKR